MVGIDQNNDYLFDAQQSAPAGWCPCCGGEIWRSGRELCSRCEAARKAEPQEKRFQHTFTVTASTPKLRGLRAFLEINNYQFREKCNTDV